MSRKHPEVPHELDPLKGGLKHHPFAALREKLATEEAHTAPTVVGEQPKHVEGSTNSQREQHSSSAVQAKLAGRSSMADDRASGDARTLGATRAPARATGTPPKAAAILPRERVTVRMERTGRGGKTVTIAEGPALAGLPLEALARDIARGMGTGARAKDGAIVVQGDQRDRLVTWLGERSFPGAVAGN